MFFLMFVDFKITDYVSDNASHLFALISILARKNSTANCCSGTNNTLRDGITR